MSGLESLQVGTNARRTFAFAAEHIETFSELVGDYAPVHFDDGFAQAKGFQGRIVHGLFAGAVFSGLLGEDLPGPESVINSISLKYRQPIPLEAQVNYEVRVKQITLAVGAVTLELSATLHDGTVCITGASTCSFPEARAD